MKSFTVAAILLAIVLGAVSAGVTTALLLGSRASAEVDKSAAAVSPSADATAELLADMRELREANKALSTRLAMLDQRPAPVARQPEGELASRADFEAFRDEIRELLSGDGEAAPGKSLIAGSPELKTQVEATLESIRVEQASVKRERAQDNRIRWMSDWLELDTYQQNEMRSLLALQDERDQELKRQWQDGADPEALGETKRANHADYQAQVENILTPQQLQSYQSKYGDGDDDDK